MFTPPDIVDLYFMQKSWVTFLGIFICLLFCFFPSSFLSLVLHFLCSEFLFNQAIFWRFPRFLLLNLIFFFVLFRSSICFIYSFHSLWSSSFIESCIFLNFLFFTGVFLLPSWVIFRVSLPSYSFLCPLLFFLFRFSFLFLFTLDPFCCLFIFHTIFVTA
jgi:hypothetical protein